MGLYRREEEMTVSTIFSMVYLLEGEAFVGYNPLNMAQTILTISLCLLIFFLGMILYSKFCWMRR